MNSLGLGPSNSSVLHFDIHHLAVEVVSILEVADERERLNLIAQVPVQA